MKASELFSPAASLLPFSEFFPQDSAPWEWLPQIRKALTSPVALNFFSQAVLRNIPQGLHIEGPVWMDDSVKLPAHATIIGPTWIGQGTEIRPGAFIRGNVIIGAHCVIGNSCEFKNCLLMEHVQVPHFSYVGDSILGNHSHLGAGAILSNLRLDQKPVTVRCFDGALVHTNLRKLGSLIGDHAEVGCNAVLNPGCILGKHSLVMPALPFAGTLAANTIARIRHSFIFSPRRD